jgi:glucose/arabinose dehydrogenase
VTKRNLSLLLALMAAIALLPFQGTASAKDPAAAQLNVQAADFTININHIVASGFSSPVGVYNAGDESGRLFVVEQTGKIRIIKNGVTLATPFLDLGSLITCCGEQGLLGLAFHPDYPAKPYFYVDYTRSGDGDTVIARYTVSGNADIADPNSAAVLLTINQPYANHNGGQLAFGPDGYLYIGMGDGGSSGDPQNNAQNLNSLLGKILRLEVTDAFPYYTSPPDNPFASAIPGLDEIWAWGLRNPWRFSFDRLTGDLLIGDVGQGSYEEVDYEKAGSAGGVNYGWNCREGAHSYTISPYCTLALPSLTDPVAEYTHALGCSITGGFVYRGQDYPNLAGRYFFADYCFGTIWSVVQTGMNPPTFTPRKHELDTGLNISSFGEDETGEVYVVDYGGTIRLLAQSQPFALYLPVVIK